MGDTDFCIDHLHHTEAEVIVEEMGAFDEDGALLITVMMQIYATFQELFIGAHRLIIECYVPIGMHV